MKIIYVLNSDFGVRNTVGFRAKPIVTNILNLDYEPIVFCRSYSYNKINCNIIKIFPYSDLVMKFLTAISIYVYKNFPSNLIKNVLFEKFLIRKMKNLNLPEYSIIHSWDFLPNFYKFIKQKNPSIKIVQDIPMAFPNVLKNIKNFDKLFPGESTKLPQYVENSLKYIDYYIVPSEFVKKSLINENIPEEKIFIVPFGVDINKFKPIADKDYYGKFKVAFSGNVNNRKGIPYLIEAWKELNLKDAELNIFGRVYPEVKPYLKNYREYNIKLHGFIKDLERFLPNNHIYVFPSLLEGSAKSTYEALACGLPVITTENAGSVVTDGEDSFIIPTQNVKAIKEKILYFYENRNELKKFSKKARKKAEKYTWENYGKNILEVYKIVLGNENLICP